MAAGAEGARAARASQAWHGTARLAPSRLASPRLTSCRAFASPRRPLKTFEYQGRTAPLSAGDSLPPMTHRAPSTLVANQATGEPGGGYSPTSRKVTPTVVEWRTR